MLVCVAKWALRRSDSRVVKLLQKWEVCLCGVRKKKVFWAPPCVDVLKFNVAAFGGKPAPTGFKTVLRNSNGVVLVMSPKHVGYILAWSRMRPR